LIANFSKTVTLGLDPRAHSGDLAETMELSFWRNFRGMGPRVKPEDDREEGPEDDREEGPEDDREEGPENDGEGRPEDDEEGWWI